MKRLLLLILAAVLLLALVAGCGEYDPTKVTIVTAPPLPTEEPSPTPVPSPTPEPTATPVPDSDTTPEVLQLQPTEPEAADAADRSAPQEDPTPTPAPERDYVLNTNTMKFHVPSCSSVKDIKDNNRKDVHMTRGDVVAMGYQPCGRCKP